MNVAQRAMYAEMIAREYFDTARTAAEDGLLAHIKQREFCNAVGSGIATQEAFEKAQRTTLKDWGLAHRFAGSGDRRFQRLRCHGVSFFRC